MVRVSPSAHMHHRWRWGILAIPVIALLLLNYPGQIVVGPDIFGTGQYGPDFCLVKHCDHGWPFTYLRREWVRLDRPPFERLSRWRLVEGVDRFNGSLLLADIVLGVAILLIGGVVVREGLRRRKRRLHFYLRDLFIVTGIIATLAALYVSNRVQYRNELNILQAIDKTRFPPGFGHWDVRERTEWQYCGPSWLRRLIGDQPFRVFDHVVGIETQGLKEIKHVAALKNLEVVRIKGAVSNEQLRLLEQLPRLEGLFLSQSSLTDEDGRSVGEQYFRLPRLPKLRGLNL